ncbi:MAG: hypothetical protein RSD41_05895 [Kiritimatiellia bacterium]
MSVPVEAFGPDGGEHQVEYYQGTLWRTYPWNSDWKASKSSVGGLTKVHYRTTYLDALLTVLSLGLYSPVEVEWWAIPDSTTGPEMPED